MTTPPQVVPLNPLPSQEIVTTLSQQACTIKVYTKHIQVPYQPSNGIVTNPPIFKEIDPIYLDLYVNDAPIITGVLCLHAVSIVRQAYLGFIGDLSFADIIATDDPQVSGLGTRWLLLYWPP